MPQSYQEYSGSSLSATTYSVTFKYLSIDDVHALGFDGNSWTTLTLDSSSPRDATNKTITLASAPSTYAKIRLYRATATTALVDFQNGSRLSEADLDTAYQQGLFVAQEVAEDANTNQFDALRDTSVLSGTQLTNFASQSFTATSGQTEFTITSFTPQTTAPEAFVVSIDGAIQAPSAYTVSMSPAKITFSSGVPLSAVVVIVTGVAASSATTVDNSTLEVVTATNQARVKDGGITPAKLSQPNPISWGDGFLAIHKATADSLGRNNSGLEIGYGLGATETGIAFIDFHSSGATQPDYDGRIQHNSGNFDFENGGNGVVTRIDDSGRVTATSFRAGQGVPNSADSSTTGFAFGEDGDTGMFCTNTTGAAAGAPIVFYGNGAELGAIYVTPAGYKTFYVGDFTSPAQVWIKSGSSDRGQIAFGDSNDDDVGAIAYRHDDNSMRFKVNANDAITITSGGTLWTGLANNTDTSIRVDNYANSYGYGIDFRGRSGSTSFQPVIFRSPTHTAGIISHGTSTTSYGESSDYRLKEDIIEMEDSLERVKELKPCNFAWKVDGSRMDGFIAHEVQEVCPDAVSGTKDAMKTEEVDGQLQEVIDPQQIDKSNHLHFMMMAHLRAGKHVAVGVHDGGEVFLYIFHHTASALSKKKA